VIHGETITITALHTSLITVVADTDREELLSSKETTIMVAQDVVMTEGTEDQNLINTMVRTEVTMIVAEETVAEMITMAETTDATIAEVKTWG